MYMFLNGLRKKSISRRIKKELKERSYRPLTTKVKTVAILQSEDASFSPASVKLLATALGLPTKEVTLMTLVKTVGEKNQLETNIFSEKQIGWNGTLKSAGLRDFSTNKYDVLINYYDTDALPLIAVSTFSNAQFKVGLTEDLIAINDLVVAVAIGDEKVFIQELKKYMHILNIID